jgi:glycerate kinase
VGRVDPSTAKIARAMTIVLAPDKFKGTLSAGEVAAAMAAGAEAAGVESERCPVADGGDGTAAILLAALGGEWREATAHDALGRRLQARWALLGDGSAVVDVAEASGLARLAGEELDPLAASSAGTGELIAAALAAGAGRVLVACGGSATTDAGLGALDHFDPAAGAEIVCLCDVGDSFEGALRYAPQKGAEAEQLEVLSARLRQLRVELPHDPGRLPYTGAAGGLAGGLWAHGARLVPGSRFVLDAVGFDRRLARAQAVITGEGALDATSLAGKAVGEVALRAKRAGVPCHALVGADRLEGSGRARFASIATAGTPAALATATALLLAG